LINQEILQAIRYPQATALLEVHFLQRLLFFIIFNNYINCCLGPDWLDDKWEAVSLDSKTLITRLLQTDQNQRPKIEDILSSTWMTDGEVITKVYEIRCAATNTNS
jgi:hypothetical protein